MNILSEAFAHGGAIPKKYGRNFENTSPPLSWNAFPEETKSFALIMDDPDVPAAAGVAVWDHWVVWNIPADVTSVPEAWKVVGILGKGTRGEAAYAGPRPPDRIHRYIFHLYALNAILSLAPGSSASDLRGAMQGHILAEATLMGTFAPQ